MNIERTNKQIMKNKQKSLRNYIELIKNIVYFNFVLFSYNPKRFTKMNDCITKIFSYPITYMGKIRQLKKDEIMLKETAFYPAYPFLVGSSIICNIILAAWMIYYFINQDINYCYDGVTLGIQILACVYPIYQIIIFLTLIISISTTKYNCWKVSVMMCFTIVSTSFGFGGLGVVYTCMINHSDSAAIPSSFLTQNYFVQIIVYVMVIFILMYVLLVPLTSWLESRRDPEKQRTGCQCFLYGLFIFFQFLLFIGFFVFLAIVLGGIPILFYLLNGVRKDKNQSQNQFFAFTIISLVVPYFVSIIVFIFKKYIGCGQEEMIVDEQGTKDKDKQLQEKETNLDKSQKFETKRKSINLDQQITYSSENKNSGRQILLETNQSKQFGQDEFITKNKKKSGFRSSTTVKK